MSILSAHEISKSYKLRKVVNGLSLEIKSGEVVGLLGPNGAGKTTAFYMIVGLISADKGQILLDGQDLVLGLKVEGLLAAGEGLDENLRDEMLVSQNK